MKYLKKIKSDQKNKYLKLGLVIAVICLLAIFPCFWFMNQKKSYEMPEDGYQNVLGEKIRREKGLRLVMDDTYGVMAGGKKQMPSAPIYVEEEDRIVLPVTYAVVRAQDGGKMQKLNYFTEIYKKNHAYYASTDKKDRILTDAFLFDGEDTYIFLQETTIMIGDREVSVSPLSYVTAPYGQTGAIYDYENEKYQEIAADAGEVQAEMEFAGTLCLSTDQIRSEESQQLLHQSPDKLKNYE